ncbi:MAG: histidine phosphatase family protein [Rhodomicrobium sp.]
MAAIYFLRHGQTDYNAARRIQGILDIPINALGRSQAQRNGGVLAELISDPSRFDFVSSPLLRARQTMEIVREAMGLAPEAYRTDARLEEIRFGDWAGMTMAQVAERDPENYARRQADLWNFPPPGGESLRELSARALGWFESVTRDTVVVSHGGINRCLRAYFLRLPPRELLQLDVPQDKVLLIEQENGQEQMTWL